MNAPCDNRTTCPDNILNNLSAEDPDEIEYVAYGFSEYNPELGKWWTVNTCFGRCVSHISQADAQACADLVADLCTPGQPPNDNWPPSSTHYYSQRAIGTYACPDGSIFSYVVPEGTFIGLSLAEANYRATSYAQEMAAKSRVCLPVINPCACVGSPYSVLIRVSPIKPAAYFLLSGALPPGISFVSTSAYCRLIGTPTSSGIYNFTIRAIDGSGNYMDKGYSIYAMQITTTQLDAYTIGSPYSFQLSAVGSPTGYIWSIVSGSLPSGLTMSSSGLITGIPTAAGSSSIKFSVKAVGCAT